MKATIKLTAYNMGDVTEADFDAWARYVAERIDELTGLDVTIDQFRFGDGFEDKISCEDIHLEQIDEVLRGLWESFCSDGSAWPT